MSNGNAGDIDPMNVTPQNMHLAIASMITTQTQRGEVLVELVKCVKDLTSQVAITNGSMVRAKSDILKLEIELEHLKAAPKGGCPGVCITLGAEVDKLAKECKQELDDTKKNVTTLHEQNLILKTKISTTAWLFGVLWVVATGGGVSFVIWLKN